MAEMSSKIEKVQFARTIDHNKISAFLPFYWLKLAFKDLISAPAMGLTYGTFFSLIPIAIVFFVNWTGTPFVILPVSIAFALIGPAFAVGLYDVAWELEKNHKPTFLHSFKAMFRNSSGEWGFVIVLMMLMIAWTRIASLIYALYPNVENPSFEELISFLTLGTSIGFIILSFVFSLSAFTPQIMIERRVDIMTAISTSISAVLGNIQAMLVWSAILIFGVILGFLTKGFGFIIIMPILAFASWHAYIAVIKTKLKRKYE